jgi:hypothetical protein
MDLRLPDERREAHGDKAPLALALICRAARYTFVCIDSRSAAGEPRGMHLRLGPARRDPANELYDCACTVLQATHELRAAAGRPGSAPAPAATLGCLEASLLALIDSSDGLRARAVADPRSAASVASTALDLLSDELARAARAARLPRSPIAQWGRALRDRTPPAACGHTHKTPSLSERLRQGQEQPRGRWYSHSLSVKNLPNRQLGA